MDSQQWKYKKCQHEREKNCNFTNRITANHEIDIGEVLCDMLK